MKAKARRFRGTKEMASCMQVMRVLQSYLDGQTDEMTARRVANHLEACRRCGLDAATYRDWFEAAGLVVTAQEFVPEGGGGHALFWCSR